MKYISDEEILRLRNGKNSRSYGVDSFFVNKNGTYTPNHNHACFAGIRSNITKNKGLLVMLSTRGREFTSEDDLNYRNLAKLIDSITPCRMLDRFEAIEFTFFQDVTKKCKFFNGDFDSRRNKVLYVINLTLLNFIRCVWEKDWAFFDHDLYLSIIDRFANNNLLHMTEEETEVYLTGDYFYMLTYAYDAASIFGYGGTRAEQASRFYTSMNLYNHSNYGLKPVRMNALFSFFRKKFSHYDYVQQKDLCTSDNKSYYIPKKYQNPINANLRDFVYALYGNNAYNRMNNKLTKTKDGFKTEDGELVYPTKPIINKQGVPRPREVSWTEVF